MNSVCDHFKEAYRCLIEASESANAEQKTDWRVTSFHTATAEFTYYPISCELLSNSAISCEKASETNGNSFASFLGEGNGAAKRIFFNGSAGSGKSSLLRDLFRSWVYGEKGSPRYEFMILVPAKRLLTLAQRNPLAAAIEVLTRIDGMDFLNGTADVVPLSLEACRSIIVDKEFAGLRSNTLIIVDGFDDISFEVAKSSSSLPRKVFEILLKEFGDVVISGRDYCRESLPPFAAPNMIVACRGFIRPHNTAFAYAVQHFRGSEEAVARGASLVAFLRASPAVLDTCAIPINVALLCVVWTPEMEATFRRRFRILDLYEQVVLWLGRRYLRKAGRDVNEDTLAADVMESPVMRFLMRLAFDSLCRGELRISRDTLQTTLRLESEIGSRSPPPEMRTVYEFGVLDVAVDSSQQRYHKFSNPLVHAYLAALEIHRRLHPAPVTPASARIPLTSAFHAQSTGRLGMNVPALLSAAAAAPQQGSLREVMDIIATNRGHRSPASGVWDLTLFEFVAGFSWRDIERNGLGSGVSLSALEALVCRIDGVVELSPGPSLLNCLKVVSQYDSHDVACGDDARVPPWLSQCVRKLEACVLEQPVVWEPFVARWQIRTPPFVASMQQILADKCVLLISVPSGPDRCCLVRDTASLFRIWFAHVGYRVHTSPSSDELQTVIWNALQCPDLKPYVVPFLMSWMDATSSRYSPQTPSGNTRCKPRFTDPCVVDSHIAVTAEASWSPSTTSTGSSGIIHFLLEESVKVYIGTPDEQSLLGFSVGGDRLAAVVPVEIARLAAKWFNGDIAQCSTWLSSQPSADTLSLVQLLDICNVFETALASIAGDTDFDAEFLRLISALVQRIWREAELDDGVAQQLKEWLEQFSNGVGYIRSLVMVVLLIDAVIHYEHETVGSDHHLMTLLNTATSAFQFWSVAASRDGTWSFGLIRRGYVSDVSVSLSHRIVVAPRATRWLEKFLRSHTCLGGNGGLVVPPTAPSSFRPHSALDMAEVPSCMASDDQRITVRLGDMNSAWLHCLSSDSKQLIVVEWRTGFGDLAVKTFHFEILGGGAQPTLSCAQSSDLWLRATREGPTAVTVVATADCSSAYQCYRLLSFPLVAKVDDVLHYLESRPALPDPSAATDLPLTHVEQLCQSIVGIESFTAAANRRTEPRADGSSTVVIGRMVHLRSSEAESRLLSSKKLFQEFESRLQKFENDVQFLLVDAFVGQLLSL